MSDVSSVMTSNPACCRSDTPLRDVAQMMVEHDCGQIPVVDADNKPVGVVTDRDTRYASWRPEGNMPARLQRTR